MRSVNRHRCYALLLILMISYAAFSLHITTHISADLVSCELCVGHASPFSLLPVAASQLLVAAPIFRIASIPLQAAAQTADVLAYHQRAPPLSA